MFKIPMYTALVIITLTGCSGVPQPNRLAELDPEQCCTSITALPLTPLTISFHQRLAMDAQQSQVPFEGEQQGESGPAVAYKIPASNENVELQIRSYISQQLIFAPQVSLYDENWTELAHYRSSDFNYQVNDLHGLERIETLIPLNADPHHMRYLVISTDPSALGQTLERTHLEDQFAKSYNVMPSKRLPLTADFSAMGSIEINSRAAGTHQWLASLSHLSKPTTAELPKNKDSVLIWTDYQLLIDQALDNNEPQRAANIAQQAAANGFSQASEYLLNELAK